MSLTDFVKVKNIYFDITVSNELEKNNGYFITKRIIDITGSLIGLFVLSPLLLIVAISIKFESKGSAIFRQKRVGQDGKVFTMYKFRSMVIDAEQKLDKLKEKNEMDGPMFKVKEDPRLTRIGKVIRWTSIDELPQLLNVLKGEMSLVGPRPNLPSEVEKFNSYHRQKLIAKPGLTCLWQVSGRNNIGFEEWMRLDIKYIKERSTLTDIKLIMKTIRLLFGDKNAS